MQLYDTVNQWLDVIDPAHGLALDEKGALGIALANGAVLTVEVEDEAGLVHLHTSLLRLPSSGRATLIEEALALDLHARQTDGAVIGLDRTSDALVLSITRIGSDLGAEEFLALLAGFAETADRLRDRLQLLSGAGPEASAPASPDTFLDPRLLA